MPKGKKDDHAPTGRALEKLFEMLPPAEIEAEMACLGSMIVAGAGRLEVLGEVQDCMRGPGDFSLPKHQAIYQACLAVYDKESALDTIQLTAHLRELGVYDDVGGIDYLVELAESVPTAVNGQHYARIVASRAVLRDLIDAAATTLRDCHERASAGHDALLEEAEQRIFAIADRGVGETQAIIPLGEQIQQTMDWLQTVSGEQALTGVPSGYRQLDDLTGGFQKAEFIVLAARPSMGKTAMALNIAENMALDKNIPVGLFSMEMSKTELAMRILSARSHVNSQKIKRNMLTDHDLKMITKAAAELSKSPIFIDDCAGVGIHDLRSRARRMRMRYDVEAIFIDYLQLMTARAESRQQEVSAISRGLKALARELDIPVICLSQLNRNPEGRTDKKPFLSDLRESGAIEQDADVVMMLHREEYYHIGDKQWIQENPDKVGLGELIVAKQRNGPVGNIFMRWDAKLTRFNDASSAHIPDPQMTTDHLLDSQF